MYGLNVCVILLFCADVAVAVISKFVKPDQVPKDKLVDIVTRSCKAFRVEDVTPVIDVNGHFVLVSC